MTGCRRCAVKNEISPAGPLAGSVVTGLLTPMMAYAELVRETGRTAESKLVWAVLEQLDRKLCQMFLDIHRQAPNVVLRLPDID